jgi:holliday junction DNA helicase RuvA
MFSYLRGKVASIKNQFLILDVMGVGYRIFLPNHCLQKLALGDERTIFIKPIYREDDQLLFGFLEENELDLFELLIKVNGVGPKMALALIDYFPQGALVQAISAGDAAPLICVPGIGRKTAERLLVELKDKLSLLEALSPSKGSEPAHIAQASKKLDEAISALIALGYTPKNSQRAVQKVIDEEKEELPLEKILSLSLQKINSKF